MTLTAVPDAGSTFGGWAGACAGTGTCVVTMANTRFVTASFTKAPTGYTANYYHTDVIGSVRAITDANGALIKDANGDDIRHDYAPFGEDTRPLTGDPRCRRDHGHRAEWSKGAATQAVPCAATYALGNTRRLRSDDQPFQARGSNQTFIERDEDHLVPKFGLQVQATGELDSIARAKGPAQEQGLRKTDDSRREFNDEHGGQVPRKGR